MPALRIEEFQDKLRECTIFGSIDIKETYHQIAIDMKIAYLCVIRSSGLIRGVAGVAKATPIFQTLLQKIVPKTWQKFFYLL